MKLIVNTATLPHFCELRDRKNILVAQEEWDTRRMDARVIADFMRQQGIAGKELVFLGGVAGPGGFTSLRVGTTVLNTLAVTRALPVYGVGLDAWGRAALTRANMPDIPVLMNSYGDGFCIRAQDYSLQRITCEEALLTYERAPILLNFIPEEKRDPFIQGVLLEEKTLRESLLPALENTNPLPSLTPEYESPPVEVKL